MMSTIVLAAIAVAMLSFATIDASGAIPGPNKLYVGDPEMTVNTEGVVEIIDGSTFDYTRIWGTLEKHDKDAVSVSMRLKGPHGLTATQTSGVGDHSYEIYYPIHGYDRHLEGEYEVTIYVNYTGIRKKVGTETFYIDVLSYRMPEIRISMDDISASRDCQDTKNCLVSADRSRRGEYVITEGEQVEWNNYGKIKNHHIYSVAEGYGSQRPEIIEGGTPGPNAFSGSILRPSDHLQVQFDEPGTVLFACRFHPWMEGLIVIDASKRGEPDGSNVSDRPDSVIDILEREKAEEVAKAKEEAERIAAEEQAARERAEAEMVAAEEQAAKDKAAADAAALDAATGNLPGQKSGGIGVLVRESPVELWGGSITADISTPRLSGQDVTVTLNGPDGDEIKSTTIDPDGNRNIEVTFIAQPTWNAGNYSLSAFGGQYAGSDMVEIVESEESCIGDTADGDRSLCIAGYVTGTDGDTVYVGTITAELAGIEFDRGGAVDVMDVTCHPGAVAVVDFDLGMGENAASIWCDGLYVNEMLVDKGLTDVPENNCVSIERNIGDCLLDDIVSTGTEMLAPPDAVGDCPIAFLAYGTYLSEPVQALREYRDGLKQAGHGWMLDGVHAAYYTVAPHIVDVLRENDSLKDAATFHMSAPILAGAWLVQ